VLLFLANIGWTIWTGKRFTTTAIAVFFLFLYATTNLILNLVHEGIIDPANLIWICLIALCLPLIKLAQ